MIKTELIPSAWSHCFDLTDQGSLSAIDIINAGEKMRAEGLTSLAVDLYRRWLANGSSTLAYAICFNLGVSLSDIGEYEEAIKTYQRAIDLREDFLPARFNIGTAQEKMGQPLHALASWRDILALTPACLAADLATHKLTLNNLGRLLEIQRQYPDAQACLRESLTLDLEQPDVIQHWLHLRQKQCAWPLLGDWPASHPERAWASASALSTLALTDDPLLQLAAARRFVDTRIKVAPNPLSKRASYGHSRLRIGYLSGDFCMHPVALLLVEAFERHNREHFEIYGYCWSPQDGSSVRQRVVAAMDHFVRIDHLDDAAAAHQIRSDEIDILIDLQGLTAGARLTLLALRPAPIQIAYLGFPGTTGHPEIDYLIADKYVLPTELAKAYSETPLYLPRCFQPCDSRREVAPPLSRSEFLLPQTSFVFCCFNNNYKITPELFAVWMRIISRVPGSVLWLLADNRWARENLVGAAEQHGIDPARLIFAERAAPPIYLARYRLADLFLDTTPFNAGTTANDALWMGLPLLTLSGRAFASRMAGSLLCSLGLNELVTTNFVDYEARAVELANAPQRMMQLRLALQAAHNSNPVFAMTCFARDLEVIYSDVASRIGDPGMAAFARPKRFLHVGCGAQRQQDTLPVFNDGNWQEIRFDIDPAAMPNILGSMTDIGALSDGSVDAVYSSHNVEHLYPHEVPVALRQFLRVLRNDGFLAITCPDLQSVCSLVAANRLTETAYVSPSGPIAAIDILFGHRAALAQGMAGMAHHTGFTRDSLEAALIDAGFATVAVISRPERLDLWAIASKNELTPVEFTELARILG